MSRLGILGGSAPAALRVSAGGSPSMGDLMQDARDRLSPSPEGQPAVSQQLAQYLASYGVNIIKNGSFESWSSGTTSAPDGWTLSGAGATIARNTTSGQIQEGFASCNVTAALNTVTRLSQTVTISATQNTRLRGREVMFAARILVSTVSRVSLELDDGIVVKTSPILHTGSGSYETLTVTITVDSAATQIKCSLLISSGASITATWDAAKLEEGSQATAFTNHPTDSFAQPRQVSATASTTTTSASYVALDSMSIANVIVDGSQSVLVIGYLLAQIGIDNQRIGLQSVRDSTQISEITYNGSTDDVSREKPMTIVGFDSKPAAGNYSYALQWKTDSDTATGKNRYLTVAVIPTL